MNAKRRDDDDDLDTSTGLPRKAVSKLFLVVVTLLQILVAAMVSHGQKRLSRMEEAQTKSDINIARIMERMNMSPHMANTGQEPDQSP